MKLSAASLEMSDIRSEFTVTFLIVTYNQERYIREAIKGALSQEGPPIEIVITDDCSTDATFSVIKSAIEGHQGHHRVKLIQTTSNLGILGNLLHGVRNSTGKWIVSAAGDDISLPRRVLTLMEYVRAEPEIAGIASRYKTIDELGCVINKGDEGGKAMRAPDDMGLTEIMSLLTSQRIGHSLKGATAAWRRDLFDDFPPIPNDRDLFEDGILTHRALLKGCKTRIVEDVLVKYRKHDTSLSNWHTKRLPKDIDDRNTKYFLRAIKCWRVTIADAVHAAARGWISARALSHCTECIEYRISYLEALSQWPSLSLPRKLSYCVRFRAQGVARFAIRRGIDRLKLAVRSFLTRNNNKLAA